MGHMLLINALLNALPVVAPRAASYPLFCE
jgi:hypothetical protein